MSKPAPTLLVVAQLLEGINYQRRKSDVPELCISSMGGPYVIGFCADEAEASTIVFDGTSEQIAAFLERVVFGMR